MNRWTFNRSGALVAAAGACCGVLFGCAGAGEGPAARARDSNDAGAIVDGPDAAIAKQLEADAAELERLRKEMVRDAGAGVDTGITPPRQPVAPARRQETGAIAANIGEGAQAGAPGGAGAPPADGAATAEPPATPAQQVARLAAELGARLGEVAEQSESPLAALLARASLALATPGAGGAPGASGSESRLSAPEAEALAAWRELARQIGAELEVNSAGAGSETVRRALETAAARLGAGVGVSIGRAALCTKVDGFGRYAEFPGRAILAGRKQRAIVYVELDRFAHRPATGADGEAGFAVELSQDLSLYHEADGLLAWRKPDQEISDFSRNRRRDFFIVQMIDLPETLTIGKYTLKVRVKDRNGSGGTTEAEVALPIEVVAQGSLVGK